MREEFRHIIMKLIILKALAKNKEYSYGILKYMGRIPLSEKVGCERNMKSTVYNIIASLEGDGMVRSMESKNRRKYYAITRKGREALKDADTVLIPIFRNLKSILERQ